MQFLDTHTSSSSDETTHRKTVDKKKAHKRRKRRGQSSLQTIVENCDVRKRFYFQIKLAFISYQHLRPRRLLLRLIK